MSEKSNEEFKKFSIKTTTDYLKIFPKKATSKTVGGVKRKLTYDEQIINIEKSFEKIIAPNKTTTKPDELVSLVLENVYEHDRSDREKIQKSYQDQKQTEMKIGALLERYISSKGKDYGWAFTGECVESVDFVKKTDGKWTTLQIKTSSNTENSSAKKVRDGTTILMWYRRNAKEGTYNWDEFPDIDLRKVLSEQGFREYVLKNFKSK